LKNYKAGAGLSAGIGAPEGLGGAELCTRRFVVSLNLRLPSGQMASHEHGHSLIAVIKAAFDDLFQQLIKHKALLSNLHYWRRKRIQSELQELEEPATSDQPPQAEVVFAVRRTKFVLTSMPICRD